MMCLHRFLFLNTHFSKESFNVTELLNLIHIPYDVEILEIVLEVLKAPSFPLQDSGQVLRPDRFQ